MKKRIFRSFFIIAALAVVVCMFLRMSDFWRYLGVLQREQLEQQLGMVARGVELSGQAYLDGLDSGSCRITLIREDGSVSYDNQYAAAQLPNHSAREEVQMARLTGQGEGYRFSDTVGQTCFYKSRLLSDGTVLRVSLVRYSVIYLLSEMLLPVAGVVFMVLVASQVLARYLTRRVMAPLKQLVLEEPGSEAPYEELAPLLRRLEQQNEQIHRQMQELHRQQNEFESVTEHMREGLLLLNETGSIVSVNPAAAALFCIDHSSVGQNFLALEKRPEVQQAVMDAMLKGHGETVLYWGSRPFQLDVSPIHNNGAVTGAVLLTFDATERIESERRRRNFTANVTHELKTPLQTILGSAELIENGMVGEEAPQFAARIRSEGQRLVKMIDEIIRLSRLEEDMPQQEQQEVDLLVLAREAADTLQPVARARQVELAVEGTGFTVSGVPRLLEEIIYNLYENAIKYNVPGGKVQVTVRDGMLQVTDTGIGIPPEDQSRVFERFYRADKSHSRKISGTGLGLSIVKHAARYHKAAVELQSEPGKGTTVTVRFPE